MALLRELEGAIGDASMRAALRGQQAHLHALAGRVTDALALAEPILESGREEGQVYVTAAMAAVIAYDAAGAHERAAELAAAALPEAERAWAAGTTSVPPEMFELERDAARSALDGPLAYDASGELPGTVGGIVVNRPVAVLLAVHAAGVELERGHPRSASDRLASVGPTEADLLAGPVAAIRSTIAALLGRAADAETELRRADEHDRSGALLNPYLDEARAWVLAASSRPAEARRSAATAAEAAIAGGRFALAIRLVHLLARLGGEREAAALLPLVPDDGGALSRTRRTHVEALVEDDPRALEAIADELAELGCDLAAAEAATRAADAWRRAGEPRHATRAARTAGDLADRCEGARTPGLVQLADAPTPLSRRELEIASLAASGLASAEIGQRLFLSPRTVDNHLQHVYQKLGISSRGALAQALEVVADSGPYAGDHPSRGDG
jgi:DNA-binding CsgD family transcriptional regulator